MEASITHIHKALVEKSKAGNRKAQFDLYNQYIDAMFYVCMRIVNNREDAEDVVQESFVKAFKNLNSFKYQSTFGAWLKRIVVNTSINHLRKKKLKFEDIEVHSFKWLEEVEEERNSQYDMQKVKKGIELLPDGYRVVLSLYLLEGYDHIEIAEILDISSSTSKTQYSRAKKKLRELVGQMTP